MSSLDEKSATATTEAPVRLPTPTGPCFVLGQKKPALTKREYEAVKALLDVYPGGLSATELERKVGVGTHEILTRLRKKDSAWAAVILMPTRAGRGGYRLTSRPKQ